MVQLASQLRSLPMTAVDRPFIAADVGGTHARIGLVRRDGADQVAVLSYHKYNCADYPSLADILQDFMANEPGTQIDRGVIACAGRPVDGVVINANLPWPVSVEPLRRSLGIRNLLFINDFEAVAHATRFFDPSATTRLAGPEHGEGPVVIVGPGTGLGSAVRIAGDHAPIVLPTEAGQINLAPVTLREIEVLQVLRKMNAYVPYESVLSGPGLSRLYSALAVIRGRSPILESSEAISAAALAGRDETAVETLHLFCALLGSFVGNLAMLFGASGGVYLTGGILPGIQDFLRRSEFTARFLDKGPMRGFLERIPVRLMEHGQLGVIGAAGWALDQQDSLA